MRRRNPHAELIVFWVKLRQRGYTRSITGLYSILRKLGEPRKTLPNPQYIPKPYEKMFYPGQRVQLDVKFVPSACIVGEAEGEKFYQYTAIDEYRFWIQIALVCDFFKNPVKNLVNGFLVKAMTEIVA